MAKTKTRSEDIEGKYKRGANRTKEQREFPEYIIKDYCEFFISQYLEYFRQFANFYSINERISEETWNNIFNFVSDATKIIEKYDDSYTLEKLEKLKYLKEPSTLYNVREKERLQLIKKFLEEYDIENAVITKTKIQEWHKINMIAGRLYLIYKHLYLYLTETKK